MPKYDFVSHEFTSVILEVLEQHFGKCASYVLESSPLLCYINKKTISANRNSKARGSFGNLYAIYVLVEDYIENGFFDGKAGYAYSKYEGAIYLNLLERQRELPFGQKLQNHPLNSRLNEEFRNYFESVGKLPIVRDVPNNQRYWIQEDLLKVEIEKDNGEIATVNIAKAICNIIEKYIEAKKKAFKDFIQVCKEISRLGERKPNDAINFVKQQLEPNVDARVFEIVSFAVLKSKYGLETIWMGEDRDSVNEYALTLYKTGRTNANDGGIDFVMKPYGRFFQVTETLDMNKYFLDIEKVQHFPITFVIKSNESEADLRAFIKQQAEARYKIESVVNSYMDAVEEIINIPLLIDAFQKVINSGKLSEVMNEIITQSKIEFNDKEDE